MNGDEVRHVQPGAPIDLYFTRRIRCTDGQFDAQMQLREWNGLKSV